MSCLCDWRLSLLAFLEVLARWHAILIYEEGVLLMIIFYDAFCAMGMSKVKPQNLLSLQGRQNLYSMYESSPMISCYPSKNWILYNSTNHLTAVFRPTHRYIFFLDIIYILPSNCTNISIFRIVHLKFLRLEFQVLYTLKHDILWSEDPPRCCFLARSW